MIDLASITTDHSEPVSSPEEGSSLLRRLGWEWDLDGDHADRGSYFHPDHPELRATIGHSFLTGFFVSIWRED